MKQTDGAILVPSTAVVHIVYEPFGPEPFARFIESYRRHPAGLPHMLLVAFKAFPPAANLSAYTRLLDGLAHETMRVPDGGFDLGSYKQIAAESDADRLCLLNSNSVLLEDNWLAKLAAALDAQGGGIVGGSGSWASLASDALRRETYKRGNAFRQAAARLVHHIRLLRHFPPFPNPHLRTNGVLADRRLLLSLLDHVPRDKDEAHRIESGRSGITRRVLARGLPVRLVNREGRAFAPDQWSERPVFFGPGQHDLLIGDNQTRRYAQSGAAEQARLFSSAWEPVSTGWRRRR